MVYKVMVIEDDDEIRQAISSSLRQDGFNVYEANNAFDALEALEKEDPHVIVSDYMLPGMNGESLLIQLRRQSQIPFIMISGFSKGKDIQSPNFYYLDKPFDWDQMNQLIKKCSSSS